MKIEIAGARIRPFAVLVFAAFLSACSTYQVTPVTNASPGIRTGQVDVLYSTPNRPYETIGMVSAKRYKPGWTDPTVSDAVPQIQAAGASVGADAVIVRSSRSNNDRHIVVEGEAIRYTDISPSGGARTEVAALARGFSSGRGCGDPAFVSESNGRWVFQAVCPAGRTLLIECRGGNCNAIN